MKEISKLFLVNFIILILLFSPILALEYYWFDSCDLRARWDISSNLSVTEYTSDFAEGEECLKVSYSVTTSEDMTLKIPEHPLQSNVTGFYLKILSWDVGSGVHGSELQIRITGSNSNRFGGFGLRRDTASSPTKRLYNLKAGTSPYYSFALNDWLWCEFQGGQNKSAPHQCNVNETLYDRGSVIKPEMGNYVEFSLEFSSWGDGKSIILLIDYITLGDDFGFPPILPPEPDEIETYPIDAYINLALLLFGLGSFAFLPLITVHKIRKKDYDWIPYALIWLFIALGCVIGGLWE